MHRAFPGDPIMQLSRETIRQSFFLQRRGEPHRGLARCPRSSRAEMVGLGHEINSPDDANSSEGLMLTRCRNQLLGCFIHHLFTVIAPVSTAPLPLPS